MLTNAVPEGTYSNQELQQEQQPEEGQVQVSGSKQQFLDVKKRLESMVVQNERDAVIVRKCLNELSHQWSVLLNDRVDSTASGTCDSDELSDDDEDLDDDEAEDVGADCLWLTLLEDDYYRLKEKTLTYLKTMSDETNSETVSALKSLQKIEHYNTTETEGVSVLRRLPCRSTRRRLTNIFRCVRDLEHSTYCVNRECPKVRCSKFKTIGLDTQHSVFRQYILLCFFHAKTCQRPTHSVCTLCKQYKGMCRKTTITATVWNRGEPRSTTTTRGSKYCTRAGCLVPYCKEFREKISLHGTAGLENMLPTDVIDLIDSWFR